VSWDYRLEDGARRDLARLGPSAAAEIRRFLDQRVRGAADPERFGKPLRGSRHGLWRFRVQDWRLLCRLEKSVLIVVVVAVGHRSTVYEA
jgi:mRNA interferase RelE/StbE